MEPVRFDDPQPNDRAVCSRFGTGAFPCGAPYKVHVTTVSMVGRSAAERRRVLCRAHYEFFVSQVSGGAGGIKARIMRTAYEELAARHLNEFQEIYEAALRRHFHEEIPELDPSTVLPHSAP